MCAAQQYRLGDVADGSIASFRAQVRTSALPPLATGSLSCAADARGQTCRFARDILPAAVMIAFGVGRMAIDTGRRKFIAGLGGAAVAWPLVVRAQQPALPVVAFINAGSPDRFARYAAAFRKGLSETGYVEGQNVTVEYHWLEGHYDRVPALVADVIRRQVAVIVTPASTVAALAAKTATATIPIVFGVAEDPVQLGLVTSLARPGGNVTGINFFTTEVAAKELRLLHDLVPKAVRIAVIVNPANAGTAVPTLREVKKPHPPSGCKSRF